MKNDWTCCYELDVGRDRCPWSEGKGDVGDDAGGFVPDRGFGCVAFVDEEATVEAAALLQS